MDLKMRRILSVGFCFFVAVSVYGQELYYNLQDYQPGTKLTYQRYNIDSTIVPGSSGEGIVWDFLDLQQQNDTLVKHILRPDSLAQAKFNRVDLIEEYADSSFLALEKWGGRTYVLGFIDRNVGVEIDYPQPLFIARRPLSYGDKISRDYTADFKMGETQFSGEGKVTMKADGFGTLMMPDEIYDEVLRVKITREQTDHIEKYEALNNTRVTTYLWFDRKHASPLLEVRKYQAGRNTRAEVFYLLNETM